MNGLAVSQDNNAEISIVCFRNSTPSTNAAIVLERFMLRVVYNALDPLGLDLGAVRLPAVIGEVLSELHSEAKISEYSVSLQDIRGFPPQADPTTSPAVGGATSSSE